MSRTQCDPADEVALLAKVWIEQRGSGVHFESHGERVIEFWSISLTGYNACREGVRVISMTGMLTEVLYPSF